MSLGFLMNTIKESLPDNGVIGNHSLLIIIGIIIISNHNAASML
jgi:hypothetical protein